jgi:3-oxoacid CoA-transferase subunit A
VPAGELNPDHIHTPGIFVKRIVEVGTAKKHIEFRNTRPRASRATPAATGVEI